MKVGRSGRFVARTFLRIPAAWALAAAVGWMAVPVAAAPGAVQVWNCERWQTVSAGDFAGTNAAMKALRPMELTTARNGVASGYVVVTRDGGAIRGLKVAIGALTQAGGKGVIPATRIQVRFADSARPEKSWSTPERFDRLLETAPTEIPAVDVKKLTRDARKGWNVSAFVPNNDGLIATVPVWVTVRVPADAAPGDYEGALAIEAEGLSPAPLAVPMKFKVHDWNMPDPKDFRVRTIGWMNPEALAKHYQTPLWSEKHFELMGKSMERMLELGSRHLPIDVTKGYPARDNADTLIKWIRQADGTFKYDFTLFDKYCDLAARKIGKPFPVRLNIWRGPRNGGGGEMDDYPNATVLVLDPTTGAVSELEAPRKLGSAEMKAFWQPVMNEIRTRLEKRGWFDAAGPNWMCYCGGMTKEMTSMVRSIWPDCRWTDVTHGRVVKYSTLEAGVFAPVFVQSTVWNEGSLGAYKKWKEGPYPRNYAGKFDPTTAWCTHARNQYGDKAPLWILRTKHEEAMLKGNDGLECVGADHFPIKDARGAYRPGQWTSYAQGPGNSTLTMLGAGDEGPLGTERLEAMREGIQLCEAMVFIQKALEAGKLNGDLAVQANKILDDRARALVAAIEPTGERSKTFLEMDDYAKGSWERDNALYAVAARVARALAEK